METTEHRTEPHDRASPLRLRSSVRTKILLVFVPLILLLGVLLALATREAARIHESLARVAEEDREAELTRSLLVELRGAEVWAERTIESGPHEAIERDLIEHLARSRALVEDLGHHDEQPDPSEPTHEARELRLRAALLSRLAAAEATVAADRDWQGVAEGLREARRQVEVLAAETKAEATRAAIDLDRGVHHLVDMLFLVAGTGVVTLLVLFWTFRRLVLRPLWSLQHAALQLGRGDVDEPVAILSRDEFGQLAHVFNEMAQRLRRHRADLEQRVEERTRELFRTARLADLGTLAAGIAHEINNPLASIAAGVEGLRRECAANGSADASTLEYIDLVVEEAHRAKEIASRLLRLGRREERRLEPVWLEREAAEVVTMLAFQAQRRGITVETDFAAELPAIEADPTEWRQVFFNLLRNAIDASPNATCVTVSGAREGDRLVVRVRDHGAGFAAEDLDRVFEPFFTTKRPGEGTGLGLAIVDRIVHESGGTVRAGNWEGGGEVTVELACAG